MDRVAHDLPWSPSREDAPPAGTLPPAIDAAHAEDREDRDAAEEETTDDAADDGAAAAAVVRPATLSTRESDGGDDDGATTVAPEGAADG